MCTLSTPGSFVRGWLGTVITTAEWSGSKESHFLLATIIAGDLLLLSSIMISVRDTVFVGSIFLHVRITDATGHWTAGTSRRARGAGEVSSTTSLFTGFAQVQEGQRGAEVIWALFIPNLRSPH